MNQPTTTAMDLVRFMAWRWSKMNYRMSHCLTF